MKIWIVLVSEDPATGLKTIARSGESGLVRLVIAALRTNRLLEDDAADVIYDPAFLVETEGMLARLTEQVRRNAILAFSEVDPAFSEVDPACSPAQEPAPVGQGNTGQGR